MSSERQSWDEDSHPSDLFRKHLQWNPVREWEKQDREGERERAQPRGVFKWSPSLALSSGAHWRVNYTVQSLPCLKAGELGLNLKSELHYHKDIGFHPLSISVLAESVVMFHISFLELIFSPFFSSVVLPKNLATCFHNEPIFRFVDLPFYIFVFYFIIGVFIFIIFLLYFRWVLFAAIFLMSWNNWDHWFFLPFFFSSMCICKTTNFFLNTALTAFSKLWYAIYSPSFVKNIF